MPLARSFVLVVAVCSPAAPLRAADPRPVLPAPDAPGTHPQVVVRVSRTFLQQLIRPKFELDQPIRETEQGATVEGSAHAAGVTGVRLQKSTTETAFELRAEGAITSHVTVTRRPVRVFLTGESPLTVTRRVVFDGTTYTGEPTCVGVCYHSDFEGICTFRNGPFSPLVRRVGTRVVRRTLPDADRQASGDIRSQVAVDVTERTDPVIDLLNDVHQIRVAGTRLITRRPGRDLERFRPALATTEEALVVGVGFAPGESPEPPTAPGAPQAPIEIWVHYKLDLLRLALLTLAYNKLNGEWEAKVKPRVRDRIAEYSPELAERFQAAKHEIKLNAIPGHPGWHVIRFSKHE